MIDLWLGDSREQTNDQDVIMDAITFDVRAADMHGTGRLAPSGTGPVFCAGRFSLVPADRLGRAAENAA